MKGRKEREADGRKEVGVEVKDGMELEIDRRREGRE